jgi:hypothetical protein
MAITVQKSRKDKKLDALECRIYQSSYTALSHLDIDLRNLSEGITPPKKIRAMSLADAAILKRFYEDCNIAADEGKRGRLRDLARRVSRTEFTDYAFDTYLVDFMNINLVKALREYDEVANGKEE